MFVVVVRQVGFLDRVLQQVEVMHDRLQLVALCSLIIAAKYEEAEEDVPPLKTLLNRCKQAFEKRVVNQMEVLILNRIGWNLNVVTPIHYLGFHARRGVVFPEDTMAGRPLSPAVPEYMSKYLDFFADLCAQEYSFERFPPSVLAGAIVVAARRALALTPMWNPRLSEIVGLREEQVAAAVVDVWKYYSRHFAREASAVETEYVTAKDPSFERFQGLAERFPMPSTKAVFAGAVAHDALAPPVMSASAPRPPLAAPAAAAAEAAMGLAMPATAASRSATMPSVMSMTADLAALRGADMGKSSSAESFATAKTGDPETVPASHGYGTDGHDLHDDDDYDHDHDGDGDDEDDDDHGDDDDEDDFVARSHMVASRAPTAVTSQGSRVSAEHVARPSRFDTVDNLNVSGGLALSSSREGSSAFDDDGDLDVAAGAHDMDMDSLRALAAEGGLANSFDPHGTDGDADHSGAGSSTNTSVDSDGDVPTSHELPGQSFATRTGTNRPGSSTHVAPRMPVSRAAVESSRGQQPQRQPRRAAQGTTVPPAEFSATSSSVSAALGMTRSHSRSRGGSAAPSASASTAATRLAAAPATDLPARRFSRRSAAAATAAPTGSAAVAPVSQTSPSTMMAASVSTRAVGRSSATSPSGQSAGASVAGGISSASARRQPLTAHSGNVQMSFQPALPASSKSAVRGQASAAAGRVALPR